MSRITLVGYDAAGYLSGLRLGFEEIGCNVIQIGPKHDFGYLDGLRETSGAQESRKMSESGSPSFESQKKVNYQRAKIFFKDRLSSRNLIVQYSAKAVFRIRMILEVPRILVKHYRDKAVIYSGGNTISGSWLEPIGLRIFRVKVIFAFHGSDIRPAYLNGAMWSELNPDYEYLQNTTKKQFRLARMSELVSSEVVLWSGITHFFRGRVNFHEKLGFPIILGIEKERKTSFSTSGLRILHMPTNQRAKGSLLVRKVIDELLEEGFDFRYVEATGHSHQSALNEIESCDLVIDQVFSDSGAGILAAEAAALGKIVIVAGMDVAKSLEILGEHYPRTNFVETSSLKETIVNVLSDIQKYRDLAQTQKSYYASGWNYVSVAKNYLALMDGDLVSDKVDAIRIRHSRGGFAPKEELVSVGAAFVSKFGVAALKLRHNRNLEQSVIDFLSQEK
jgi:hypothetical protein